MAGLPASCYTLTLLLPSSASVYKCTLLPLAAVTTTWRAEWRWQTATVVWVTRCQLIVRNCQRQRRHTIGRCIRLACITQRSLPTHINLLQPAPKLFLWYMHLSISYTSCPERIPSVELIRDTWVSTTYTLVQANPEECKLKINTDYCANLRCNEWILQPSIQPCRYVNQ